MYSKYLLLFLFFTLNVSATEKILNISYDPTRKLYEQINKSFEDYYYLKYNQQVKILQSHGGSGKQARSIIEGIPAHVASLATENDIDEVVKRGKIKYNWRDRFPNNSAPFSSTIVFLVKKGNPKSIKDWDDLVKDDIKVLMPNPKTSGVAKLEYIAAWLYSIEKYKSENLAYDFMKKLFKNIPVLDSGSRGSSLSFSKGNLGDVLITWENEAYLMLTEKDNEQFEIIFPSRSIQANLPVTLVDFTVRKKHHQKKIAKEYIMFLYTKEAQEIAAQNYFRPSNLEIMNKFKDKFQEIKMFNLNILGDFNQFHIQHFNKNGILDQIFEENKL